MINNYRLQEVTFDEIRENKSYGRDLVIEVNQLASEKYNNVNYNITGEDIVNTMKKFNLVPNVILDCSDKVKGVMAILYTNEYKGVRSELTPLRVIGLVRASSKEVLKSIIQEMKLIDSDIVYEPSQEDYLFYKLLGVKVIGGF